jgi:hypothetical protein
MTESGARRQHDADCFAAVYLGGRRFYGMVFPAVHVSQ